MLTIELKRVPGVLGIYGTKPIGGAPKGDYFPPSNAFLHPDAADAYLKLEAETGKKLRPKVAGRRSRVRASLEAPGGREP